jgi:mannose-6-phosphate isomerase-like protein (cupin superfamily)
MRAGDELANPVTGERAAVREGSEDTGGEYLLADLYVSPGGRVALPHLHPALTETFDVLEGHIGVLVDGHRSTAGPGQRVTVPPATIHDWWNEGGGLAHVLAEVRGPGVDRFELLLETLWGLGRDGKTNAKGVPNLLQLAVIIREFRDVIRLATPPSPIQTVTFAVLAPVGRAVGYRAVYRGQTPRGSPSQRNINPSQLG